MARGDAGGGDQARAWRVRGRVQGVWFRGSTAQVARQLALRGHATNLPDGSVRVLAVGSEAALDRLEQWLAVGPPAARVSEVAREDGVLDHTLGALPEGFETR